MHTMSNLNRFEELIDEELGHLEQVVDVADVIKETASGVAKHSGNCQQGHGVSAKLDDETAAHLQKFILELDSQTDGEVLTNVTISFRKIQGKWVYQGKLKRRRGNPGPGTRRKLSPRALEERLIKQLEEVEASMRVPGAVWPREWSIHRDCCRCADAECECYGWGAASALCQRCHIIQKFAQDRVELPALAREQEDAVRHQDGFKCDCIRCRYVTQSPEWCDGVALVGPSVPPPTPVVEVWESAESPRGVANFDESLGAPPLLIRNAHVVVSDLNGDNGEFTGSDDRGKGIKMPKNVRKELNKQGKKFGNILKKSSLEALEKQVTKLATGIEGMGAYRGQGAYGRKRFIQVPRPMSGSGAYRGQGAYNQLFPGMTSDRPMKIASANNETGIITVSKREYLFDLFSPSVPAAFVNNKFQANPGLGALGPFVAQIAGNYEKYRYRKLVFEYHPVVTDSSSTGQMGTVVLAFNSNAGSSGFVTKQQMAEYDGSLTRRVCDDMSLGAECDPRKGGKDWLFVRTGNVPVGQDIKSYDTGSFNVATSGVSPASFPAGTQLGEIWAEYEVDFAGPKLYDALGFSILTDSFVSGGTMSNVLPLGTAPSKSSLNSMGGTLTKTTSTVYTFPDNFQGWVRVMYFCVTTVAVTQLVLLASGNITNFNDLANPSGSNVNALAATTATQTLMSADYYVQFASAANGNYLTLSHVTLTGGNVANLTITQMNSSGGSPYGATSNFVAV